MEKSINEKEQCVQTDVMQSVLFEDDLVTYETALLAREKGFDIDYGWKLRKLDDGTFTHTNCSDLGIEQPTQSLLQKWLREVKGENITPPLFFSYQCYACDIMGFENTKYFKTYEEALENELYKCLQRVSETVA